MSDVYVSCALRDRHRAERLVRELESLGWKVWWHGQTPPGMTDANTSTDALRRSRCIIVLWSAESIESGWVRDEAKKGLRRKCLIPVRIDPIEPPKGFRSAPTVELIGWEGGAFEPAFRELISRLSAILGQPPKGDPQVVAVPSRSKSSAYWWRWVFAGLIGLTLVGLGARARFYGPAELGVDNAAVTRLDNPKQPKSMPSDQPPVNQQEEQDADSEGKDNTAQQHRSDAQAPKNQDQVTKDEPEELPSKSRRTGPDDPDRDAYEDARAAFRAGDYQTAVAAFDAIVKHSPHGPFASKAQYWIADCWFELHDYRSAIAARRTFIADYPDSAKLPEAMLGLAAAYAGLGDSASARKTLEALISRFPASQAAWRGHRQLAKLR